MLDETGLPIQLLPDQAGRPAQIDGNGTVYQGDTVVAKLGLVEFTDRTELTKIGQNLFAAGPNAQGLPATDSTVLPGHLEGSTVDPVTALVDLIEASRAYQLNANLISLQDSTIGQAVSRVGRIG